MLASSDKAFFNVLYRGLMHCGRVSDHVTSPYSNVVTSMLGVPVYDKIQQTAVIEQRFNEGRCWTYFPFKKRTSSII